MRLKKTWILLTYIISIILVDLPVYSSHTIKVSHGIQEDDHIESVGAVLSVTGNQVSIGTGTYIGNKKILTAGHIFQDILPKSINKLSGPVVIDLSKHNVFWTDQLSVGPNSKIEKRYRATKLVLDSVFINEFAGNTEPPNLDDIKSDLAIIVLEEAPNIPKLSVIDSIDDLPVQASNVGYGAEASSDHNKHSNSQTVYGLYPINDWGVIVTNLPDKMLENASGDRTDPVSLKKLLAKSTLYRVDIENSRARHGDSGGPLLVVSPDNVIRIAGVLSAYSDSFNAFSSLLDPTPNGYIRSRHFDELLSAAR